MGIELSGPSPAVLAKVVYAGANAPSFEHASKDLRELAELEIAAKQVERWTRRIGQERVEERDEQVQEYQALRLIDKVSSPINAVPELAVVQIDGGRLQIRDGTWGKTWTAASNPADRSNEANDTATAEGGTTPGAVSAGKEGPPRQVFTSEVAATQAGAEVTESAAELARAVDERRQRHWREDKVGCLMTMTSETSEHDPCPEIPECFLNPRRIEEMVRELGHSVPEHVGQFASSAHKQEAATTELENTASKTMSPTNATLPNSAAEGDPERLRSHRRRPGAPEVEQRTVIGSRRDAQGFAPLLVAKAWALGFAKATRKAFVADGAATNWSIHQKYFSDYVGILDFIHALTYVFMAAMAGRPAIVGWDIYVRWIRWVWGGQVELVLAELRCRANELGAPPAQAAVIDPRKIVADALGYLEGHQQYMRYGEYRCRGLPITSCYIESTIKQMNRRVKGTEKFWSDAGAEEILQLRGDYLSDGNPMQRFWEARQANATGQRRYRLAA